MIRLRHRQLSNLPRGQAVNKQSKKTVLKREEVFTETGAQSLLAWRGWSPGSSGQPLGRMRDGGHGVRGDAPEGRPSGPWAGAELSQCSSILRALSSHFATVSAIRVYDLEKCPECIHLQSLSRSGHFHTFNIVPLLVCVLGREGRTFFFKRTKPKCTF